MKFPVIATAAAILTGIHAQESCSVCPGGINVDPDTETENGNTCGNIQSDAARFDAEDNICDRIKGFEELCCGDAMDATTETPVEAPESDATCSVCPNGITVDADTETEGNNVCGTIQADAARFETDDNICGRIKAFESTCCPDVPTTVAAISTTETGSTTAAAATTAAAVTSGSAAAVVVNSTAAAVVSSTVFIASTEAIFTTAVSGSSCVVCPGGITAPLTLSTVAGKTCADLLPDAAEHENGDALCEIIKQSEDICCPDGGFVGCSVCDGGITVSGATLVLGDKTCDDIMMDVAEVPESSNACAQAKGHEDTCCPAIITTTTSTDAVANTTAVITTTTSTEATATAAANTTNESAGEATSSTTVASVSSTTAVFDFDLNMTNSPTKAPAPVVITMSPIDNENLPPSTTISGFNEVYDPSRGFSISVKPGSMFASIVIVCVMVAKLS